jgi:hypothetical protein
MSDKDLSADEVLAQIRANEAESDRRYNRSLALFCAIPVVITAVIAIAAWLQ